MSKPKKAWNDNPTLHLPKEQIMDHMTRHFLHEELKEKIAMATPDSTVKELIACLTVQEQMDGTNEIEFDVNGTQDGVPIVFRVNIAVFREGERLQTDD